MVERLVGVLIGVLLLHNGLIKLVTGEDGVYWDFPVPAWTGWIQAPLGLYILYLSLRAILRGKGKPRKTGVTDEEVAAAKAEMDRLHLKIYGVPPEHIGDTRESGPDARERMEKK